MSFVICDLYSFELPYNIWCLGCERHLARGVRFNAEKKEIGKYYSTPILSFRMKCPSCSGWIEIHTDPAKAEYQVISGARRKNEEFSAEDNEIGGTRLNAEESEKLATNPFFKLEHEARDTRRAKEQLPRLESLQTANDFVFRDDWEASKAARKVFRAERVKAEAAERLLDEFTRRNGPGFERLSGISLSAEYEEDVLAAKEVDFSTEYRQSQERKRALTQELKEFSAKPKKSNSQTIKAKRKPTHDK